MDPTWHQLSLIPHESDELVPSRAYTLHVACTWLPDTQTVRVVAEIRDEVTDSRCWHQATDIIPEMKAVDSWTRSSYEGLDWLLAAQPPF